MIHLYYGDGKGKTSHAIGISIRQIACDKKVAWFAFLKTDQSSEHQILKQYLDLYFNYDYQQFYFQMDENNQKQVKRAQQQLFKQVEAKISQYDCVILDELLDVIDLKMIDLNDVITLLKQYPDKEIIMTGRNPALALIDCCDYVSEIKCIKHPFQQKQPARKGIEY